MFRTLLSMVACPRDAIRMITLPPERLDSPDAQARHQDKIASRQTASRDLGRLHPHPGIRRHFSLLRQFEPRFDLPGVDALVIAEERMKRDLTVGRYECRDMWCQACRDSDDISCTTEVGGAHHVTPF